MASTGSRQAASWSAACVCVCCMLLSPSSCCHCCCVGVLLTRTCRLLPTTAAPAVAVAVAILWLPLFVHCRVAVLPIVTQTESWPGLNLAHPLSRQQHPQRQQHQLTMATLCMQLTHTARCFLLSQYA